MTKKYLPVPLFSGTGSFLKRMFVLMNFFSQTILTFFPKIDKVTLAADPDPNWAKILDPDPIQLS